MDAGALAEDVPHRGPQALRAVEHDQQGLIEWEPAFAELAEEARDDALVLALRLHEAKGRFSPVAVTPSAITS